MNTLPPRLALLCGFAALSFTALSSPSFAQDTPPDFAHEKLSGDWAGHRTDLYNKGFDFELGYTADAWRNLTGGVARGNRVNDDLDLIVNIDAEKALGSKGTSAKIYILNNNGGRINDLVGSNGGIDNIEVPTQAFKLYEAWIQQNFFDDRISILAGLHDLNSEFYVTDTSGLFINPTYGIGTEMAATGDNGPSIFPYSSLGVRIKTAPTENTYLMAAVYDGVPGDPNRTRGTHVRFNDNDGALIVVEGGIASDDVGHFGMGGWEYTAERPDQVTASKNVHSRGFYFLADRSLYADGDKDISAFGRLGFAAGNVEQFRSNASVGLVLSGYVPQRPDGQIGFAMTYAENSDKYEASNAPVDGAETQFELTYSDRLMPWLNI